MKLPSIGKLISSLTESLRRFPLGLVAAIIGSVVTMIIFHMPQVEAEAHFYYWNIVMCCYIFLLLSIAATVYTERRSIHGQVKWLIQLACLAISVIYYFTLPDQLLEMTLTRFFMYALALHFFIVLVPFINKGEINGFWQYNKILLLRFLTTAFFSHVLYLGLMLAILAVNELFKAGINEKIYFDLWVFLAGIFQTWFFLAGFPDDFSSLESKTDYPKGMKIFTQYVLLPLLTIYLLILYAFMFKIIFTNHWPDGWVSSLVLGFSSAGILSLLLIYPVKNNSENKWMQAFSRFFYFMLLPLIVLLFFAITKRIRDYGITEPRYIVLILAFWLLFIALYLLISKAKNIKLIPFSLGVIALIISFGPWGAFSVSLNSQKVHLESVLNRSKMLSGGKILKAGENISTENSREISSVIEYLVNVHGYKNLQPYFSQNLDTIITPDLIMSNPSSHKQVDKILSLINVIYAPSYQTKAYDDKIIDYACEPGMSVEIAGYDYFISDFNANKFDSKDTICNSYKSGEYVTKICIDMKKNQMSVSGISDSALIFDLNSLVQAVKKKKYVNYNLINPADLTLISENEKFGAKIIFRNLYGQYSDSTVKIFKLHADILLKLNRE